MKRVIVATLSVLPVATVVPAQEPAQQPSSAHRLLAESKATLKKLEEEPIRPPSKLEQWQARDDLLKLIQEADDETVYGFYIAVTEFLKYRERGLEELEAIRNQIEENGRNRALRARELVPGPVVRAQPRRSAPDAPGARSP